MRRILLIGTRDGLLGFAGASSLGAFSSLAGPVLALALGWLAGRRSALDADPLPELTVAGQGAFAGFVAGLWTGAGQVVGGFGYLVYLELSQQRLVLNRAPWAEPLIPLLVMSGSALLALAVLILAAGCGALGAGAGRRQRLRRRHWLLKLDPASAADPVTRAWERQRRRVPPTAFSSGSIRPFAWYFTGDSQVGVRSVESLGDWLRDCTYVQDHALFQQSDFWQHPLTFEQIRRGDCEDRALWAWRKLTELGLKAELVVGVFLETGRRHAWVLLEMEDRAYLLEPTRKRRDPIIPLEEALPLYRPEFAVDAAFHTYRFPARPSRGRASRGRAPDST